MCYFQCEVSYKREGVMMMKDRSGFISLSDIAVHYGVSDAVVRKWIESGVLPATRLDNGKYVVRFGDFEAMKRQDANAITFANNMVKELIGKS
jgi:uncharacterized protein (DUF362 family)